ncbi:hypothetical protein [Limnoglobus roseus]|uniref:Uncharacterized protein n=1 Tax=Limnoglobus roseus TaxID=2598579 RepID=A0A5C1A682_9BACT|nr:hypothetical protein [Limnoglobus roseus]QEL14739.1 hypothetical protein PX52LOC_01633 [Limnoglobus roseus]
MARTRKKEVATQSPADTSFNPSEFDSAPPTAAAIVQQVADSTRLPDADRQASHENGHSHVESEARRHGQHATGHIANPSSKRRESHAAGVRKLPGTLMVKAGDLAVRLIDAGDNRMGIGIKVDLPEGRTLSDEEKQIIRRHVKGEDGEQTGFSWDNDNKMWLKQIVRQGEDPGSVPSTRPVAIRLDAESRVEKLADALRQHQADPVSYAESVRQRREQAAESGRIPD